VAENARASVIGKVTDSPIYRLHYRGTVVCEAKALDITCGLVYTRPTALPSSALTEPTITCDGATVTVRKQKFSLSDIFKTMLRHPNGASREPIIRHYDKNIIGNTLLEPGEGDAGVFAPLQDLASYVHKGTHPGWEELSETDRWTGVAVAADGNGRYGRISAYLQGVNAAVESMRNVAATGASPRALTDCLNYGNPEIPEQLSALEEGVKGIADAAREVKVEGECVPIISGNVSLYNGKPDGSAIDPTAVVCCAGVLPDARKAVSMKLKSPASTLLLVGERKDECGGSLYYEVLEQMTESDRDALLGKHVPNPDFASVSREIAFVTRAMRSGPVRACHDISDGGLLLALFEMTLPTRKQGGTTGIDVDLDSLKSALRNDQILFSQTGGFLLEVPKEDLLGLLKEAEEQKIPVIVIGETTPHAKFSIRSGDLTLISEPLPHLHSLWKDGLRKAWN